MHVYQKLRIADQVLSFFKSEYTTVQLRLSDRMYTHLCSRSYLGRCGSPNNYRLEIVYGPNILHKDILADQTNHIQIFFPLELTQ